MTKEEFKKMKVNRDPEDQGFKTIIDLINGKSEEALVKIEKSNNITAQQQEAIEKELKEEENKGGSK